MKTLKNLDKHKIEADASVIDAIAALNDLSGSGMTLFVTSERGELMGTVTDGDIRRALLQGVALENPVTTAMNRNFISASSKEELPEKIRMARSKGIGLLPVTEKGIPVNLIDLQKVKASLPIDAVLMAGGRGERLRPLTDTTPKPLLTVGDKPIIEYNVEALEAFGVENIFVTVNWLASLIKEYFSKREGDSKIICIEEPSRLGTMGSLSLIDGFVHDNVLLMNSDLLTEIDIEAFYSHHLSTGSDLTVAAVPYSVSVPFAIMKMDKERVTGIEEKPTFNYLANAGVYLMKRSVLHRLKKGEYMDAPDFIAELINDGGAVACYPVEGTWIDIGSPADYKFANELMSRGTKK